MYKQKISNIKLINLKGCVKYQIPTPQTAIINVGDSALWLNITTQINTDASINCLKSKVLYAEIRKSGKQKSIAPMAKIGNLASVSNTALTNPITESP